MSIRICLVRFCCIDTVLRLEVVLVVVVSEEETRRNLTRDVRVLVRSRDHFHLTELGRRVS